MESTSKPWSTEANPLTMASYLDFLSDDFILGGDTLDSQTLAAVTEADAPVSQSRKRSRIGGEPVDKKTEDDEEDDECDAEGDGGESGLGKRGKGKQSQAAMNKACREKARREKINDRFTELAKLIDPGKEPKTDKLSILSDAIRFVQQMRVESNQLKQLNKFLEERVAQYEKERTQMMYQQFLSQQQAMCQVQAPAGGGLLAPCVTGIPCGPTAAPGAAQTSTALPPTPVPPTFVLQHKPLGLPTTALAPLPSPGYWVPSSMLDSTQDSLLRPPAA